MQISIQPILTWPRKLTASRNYSRFKATYSQTVDLLERELFYLNAHSIAVQLAIRPEDIRLDGAMRANANPSHPGVILSFTGRHGAVTMPCDRYTDSPGRPWTSWVLRAGSATRSAAKSPS